PTGARRRCAGVADRTVTAAVQRAPYQPRQHQAQDAGQDQDDADDMHVQAVSDRGGDRKPQDRPDRDQRDPGTGAHHPPAARGLNLPAHQCAHPARRPLRPEFPRLLSRWKASSRTAAPATAVSQVERLKNPCSVWTWNSFVASQPPPSAPATPIRQVRMRPCDLLPGISILASSPAPRPRTIHAMMPMTDSSVSNEIEMRGSRSCATGRGGRSDLPRALALFWAAAPFPGACPNTKSSGSCTARYSGAAAGSGAILLRYLAAALLSIAGITPQQAPGRVTLRRAIKLSSPHATGPDPRSQTAATAAADGRAAAHPAKPTRAPRGQKPPRTGQARARPDFGARHERVALFAR